MEGKRISNCCGANPLGELCEDEVEGVVIFTGRCSKCGDGAEFFTEEELQKEENRYHRPFDSEMGMGGAGYNDTMFGAGDELEHERMDD